MVHQTKTTYLSLRESSAQCMPWMHQSGVLVNTKACDPVQTDEHLKAKLKMSIPCPLEDDSVPGRIIPCLPLLITNFTHSLWMIFSCPEHEMSFQSHLGIFYLIIKPSDGPGAALYLASNHQVCSFSAKPSSMWHQCCSVTEVLLWYEVYLGDGNGDNVSRYLWFHNGLLCSTTHNIWSIYLLLIIFIHQFILLHVLCDKMSHFRGLEYCSFPVGAPKEKLNKLFQVSISPFGIWAKKPEVITYMVPEVISYTVVLPHNLQTKCFSHDKNLCVQFQAAGPVHAGITITA